MALTRRNFIAAAAAACGSLSLAACGNGGEKDRPADAPAKDQTAKKKLIVFAAASLTESLDEAGQAFCADRADVDLSFNFDSSGTLKTQIQEGAPCDVFISAGQKQMNQLDKNAEKGNDEGLDFIEPDTRFDILQNKVVLVVPDGNPEAVDSFEVMKNKLEAHDILVALGNEDVPVGQYSDKIFAYLGLDQKALADDGCITYGSNVKEVTTQVSEAAVACGIVYATDAFSAGLDAVDEATEEMCGKVVYPAAAIKGAPQLELAKEFLEFLKGPAASECFEKVGFTPLAEQ